MRPNISHLIIAFCCTFFVGCSSLQSTWNEPYYKDLRAKVERQDLEDEDKRLKLSFLAREMMEADDRKALLSEITDVAQSKGWDYLDSSIAAQMVTDASVGQAGSALGQSVGTHVAIAGLLFSEIKDGSMDKIGQAFLPGQLNGTELTTAEQAMEALSSLTKANIETIAETIGFDVDCVHGCDTTNQIFVLRAKKGTINPGYVYWTDTIVVKTDFPKIQKVKKGDPISSVLGEHIKWKTPQGFTYLVEFFSEPTLNDSGEVVILHNKKTNHFYPAVKRNLVATRLGRDLLNYFHHSKYTIYGNKEVHPKLFFHHDSRYSFISNSDTRMIDMIVVDKPLGL